ncbi:FAD dependent monooxygenase [Colletotrichum tofieldiae]|nr:FAD dependent monooxygenase [Colletotrichum tofieldiae]
MGFKVIIVGGSISGLSLANMLEKFGIEYVLLEGHSVIAPQPGLSEVLYRYETACRMERWREKQHRHPPAARA